MEDVWRGEAQDLLTQIAQLQEENKSLLTNLSIKDPMSEEDLQRHEGEEQGLKALACAADLVTLDPPWFVQEMRLTFTDQLCQSPLC